MTQTLRLPLTENLLVMPSPSNPNVFQIRQRIQQLTDHYLSPKQLNERLNELPQQFQHPRPRPWKAIDWQAIAPNQVIGMKLSTFLAILKGAIDTEAPVRGYTQTSRCYLEHPVKRHKHVCCLCFRS